MLMNAKERHLTVCPQATVSGLTHCERFCKAIVLKTYFSTEYQTFNVFGQHVKWTDWIGGKGLGFCLNISELVLKIDHQTYDK